MSDFVEYLAALRSGDTSALPEPRSKVTKYLAKALGTWDGELPPPTCEADAYLYLLAKEGVGGKLPELLNPASAAEILAGYEAIGADGKVIAGALLMPEGDIVITNASYLFAYGARVDIVAELISRFNKVTSLEKTFFWNDDSFEGVGVSTIDTSEVTSMEGAFGCNDELISLDLSAWDTSKVKYFTDMFEQCHNLKEINMSGWNTESATSMKSMFETCQRLANLDVSHFNTSNVTDMSYMFKVCECLESVNLSGWDTSKVKNFGYMFQGCKALKSVDMSHFDTSTATSFSSMFTDCFMLREIIGFSAVNKAGISIGFPFGTASSPSALGRLTFRTDLGEGVYSIRSAIKIPYNSFSREGMVEMFNTLPDVSALGLTTAQTTITITGNLCLLDRFELGSTGYLTFMSYQSLCEYADIRYAGLDYMDVPVTYFAKTGENTLKATTVAFRDLPEDIFDGTEQRVLFKASSHAVPDAMKLDDATRQIALNKGWTLVE